VDGVIDIAFRGVLGNVVYLEPRFLMRRKEQTRS
jgi:hypothetical protein